MKKLAIVTTHPIQYNAPFFKLLTQRGNVHPKVYYTWPQAINGFDDPDFEKRIEWDIPLLEGYEWEAVENVSKYPSSKTWGGIICPGLRKKIEDFSPDAVLIYGWNLKSHFLAMRYFKGRVPIWFFGDSTLLDEKPGIRKILRRLWLRYVYRNVDKAFYVGSSNKEYFLTHGLKQSQLTFFPHAVDNKRFEDNNVRQYELKARKWRKELGYAQKDIVLMFAGKFEVRKNLKILIESVKNIHKTIHISIHLLMVGNGPLKELLKMEASGHPNIKFLPFQNQLEMPILYRVADIFCLPSKSETWGLGINEAMACGRPVLASNKVGSAIDLIDEYKNGAIFHFDLEVDLKNNLEKLIEMDLVNLGENAKEKISGWTFEHKCNAIERNI